MAATRKHLRSICGIVGLIVLAILAHWAAGRRDKPTPGGQPQASSPAPTAQSDPTAPVVRPNILLLTVDALRRDHLVFYGYPKETTPFLASLAARSTVFRRAYSTTSWTVPALASMLTGVYPAVHGATHGVVKEDAVLQQEVLPPSLSSVVERLQRAGYRTYAVLANAHLDEAHGFARGFDRFVNVGFRPADELNGRLLPFAQEIASSERPVFLWVHYFDPHQPCYARQPWLSRFQADLSAEESQLLARLDTRREVWGMILRGGRRGRELGLALYDSEIAYCDEHIARLFESIPSLNQFLIVFTADHGEEYLDHGDLGHGFNLHEETVGVPLFVRAPGGGDHQTSDRLVSLLDIPPTLAAITGADGSSRWQGEPVFDALGQPLPAAGRELLAELDRFRGYSHAVIIGERWKLLWDRSHDTVQMFDLAADPGERADLAAVAPERAAALAERLRARLGGMRRVPVSSAEVDPEQAEALHQLGYVTDDEP